MNAVAWSEPELKRFEARVGLFLRRGWDEPRAEQWADRLVQRDAEGDDRHLCIECSNLRRDGTCFGAAQGWVHGASRRLNPVTDVLARCEAFKPVPV